LNLGSIFQPSAHPIHKNVIFIVAIAKGYQNPGFSFFFWKTLNSALGKKGSEQGIVRTGSRGKVVQWISKMGLRSTKCA
jgi:hypothetical protein